MQYLHRFTLALVVFLVLGTAGLGCAADSRYPNVQAKDVPALLAERPEMIVLDVRTPGEFESGHIEGALNIDATAAGFAAMLKELDPKGAYLVHCRSGNRSGRALPTFEKLGFTDVTHMEDGILGWNEAGLPLVK